jgi:hypothetical protein
MSNIGYTTRHTRITVKDKSRLWKVNECGPYKVPHCSEFAGKRKALSYGMGQTRNLNSWNKLRQCICISLPIYIMSSKNLINGKFSHMVLTQ